MKPARAELELRDPAPSHDGVDLVVQGELGPGESAEVLALIRRIRDKHRRRAGQRSHSRRG